MRKIADEPWKKTIAEMWIFFTRGKKSISKLLVLIIFLFPAAYGIAKFYVEAFQNTVRFFRAQDKTLLSPDEEELRNEWVAVVSYSNTKQDAEQARDRFRELYVKYETNLRYETGNNEKMYAIWRDDLRIARDPEQLNRWILAIDTYTGPSSQPAVQVELARISKLGGRSPEAENQFQVLFVGSKVLCYSQTRFESLYGRIDPPPPKKSSKDTGRVYPPCESQNKI